MSNGWSGSSYEQSRSWEAERLEAKGMDVCWDGCYLDLSPKITLVEVVNGYGCQKRSPSQREGEPSSPRPPFCFLFLSFFSLFFFIFFFLPPFSVPFLSSSFSLTRSSVLFIGFSFHTHKRSTRVSHSHFDLRKKLLQQAAILTSTP